MSKLRIAITADTYPYASDVTNLVRAPFTARGLVDIVNELGALPIVLPDVPGAKLFPADRMLTPLSSAKSLRSTLALPTTSAMFLKQKCSKLFTRRASRFSAFAAAASSSTL